MDNADFHRFELMDKLDVGGSAQAKVLQWDGSDWTWDGIYIISVRDFEGRHFGLPGERGIAKCWGDSHMSEIIDLAGLIRYGKLTAKLSQGGSAQFQIYKNGLPLEYYLTVNDWTLGNAASLAPGTKCWVQYDPPSKQWYVVASTPSKPVLGRAADGIANNESGTINVYSVPSGGNQGNETQVTPSKTITALNKFFGYVTKNAWVMCEDDGDGYYITDTIQGDHLQAVVIPTTDQSNFLIDAFSPPVQTDVYIQPSDQAVGIPSSPVTVSAFVRYAPVLQGEKVTIVWTGSIFTIVAGQYDGGILGQATADISKGGTGSVLVALADQSSNPNDSFNQKLTTAVKSPLGSVSSNKKVYISRNANGFFVTSEEC